MNIYEFRLLTHQQKCEVTYREGIYLATIENKELCFNLYSIGTFYVEIVFHLHDNYLDTVRIFHTAKYLEPYLERIEIIIDR